MAKLFPRILDPDTKSHGEAQFFKAVAAQLSDDWVVFHSIQRLTNDRGQRQEGEADFVLAHPEFGILIVELKGGRIAFDKNTRRFSSRDRHGVKHDIGDPFKQAADNKGWLVRFLRDKSDWPRHPIVMGYCVAFPNQIFTEDWSWLDYHRALILDENDLLALEKRMRQCLNFWRKSDVAPGPNGIALLEKYLGSAPLIRNPLLADHIHADQQQILELTEDQFEVLNALEQNHRVLVRGCAGSGKTMLAVEKARRLAIEDRRKVLYVCFNEALSLYIGQTLGYVKTFHVFSYYRLVRFWGNNAGLPVEERSTPEGGQAFFESEVPDRFLQIVGKIGPQYDAIVVDEVQDFNQKQWDSLFSCLRDPVEGSIYAFGDEHQRIFPLPQTQPAFTGASGFVSYALGWNCRNTQTIAKALNEFYQESRLPKAKGPAGVPVEVEVYKDASILQRQLGSALHRLIAEQQVPANDIIVLTVRRSRRTDANLPGPPSELDGLEAGRFRLTGTPPETANHIFTKSIYSFKGLERPVVILCEIDDQIPAAKLWPLLYTAMSRAKSHLIVLANQSADESIMARIHRIARSNSAN